MTKLKVGEKYLSVSVLGGKSIGCFKNKDKKKKEEPDYKGDGIAIWINEKQPPKTTEERVEDDDVL